MEIKTSNTYKGIEIHKTDNDGLARGIVELRNHLIRNVTALDQIFKHDFDSEFIQEVKDSLDFNWMIDLKDKLYNNLVTSNEVNNIIDDRGNSALTFLMLRQSILNPIRQEKIQKNIEQYK